MGEVPGEMGTGLWGLGVGGGRGGGRGGGGFLGGGGALPGGGWGEAFEMGIGISQEPCRECLKQGRSHLLCVRFMGWGRGQTGLRRESAALPGGSHKPVERRFPLDLG